MSADFRAVEHIEGPYWDYSRRAEACEFHVNQFARLIADNFVAGDPEFAGRFIPRYLAAVAAEKRCQARYAETRQEDFRWIGWH